MSPRQALLVLAALAAAGCGGGSPTGPDVPPVSGGNSVAVVVFYDENGDGVLESSEAVRVPGVVVDVGGRTATTEKGTGRAVVSGVASGVQTVSIRAGGLPPFYVAGATATVQVPQSPGSDVMLAARLPIGGNVPNTYMAFGDSISSGEGSTDGTGYRNTLQSLLQQGFGSATVIDRGAPGTQSGEGAERIARGLRTFHPAYTLILYGTNDWNSADCQAAAPCFTVDSLRQIVESVKSFDSLPVVATIPPGNPAFPQVPPERNQWVHQVDTLVRSMARQEGAPVADLEGVFLKQASLTSLFSDHIHPNDTGYALIAQEWYRAISTSALAASGRGFERLDDLDGAFFTSPAFPRPGRKKTQ
jgi:lysophospholipase L1-like esterase